MRKAIVLAFCLLAVSRVLAQESFLTFDWLNDGQAIPPLDDDRWFTNGLAMRYGLPLFKKASAAKPDGTGPAAPGQSPTDGVEGSGDDERAGADASTAEETATDPQINNAEERAPPQYDPWYWLVFTIAQNMYTPADILQTVPQYDDRPYAGWSRFGWALYRQKERNFKSLGFSIGMLGEAGAGVTQTLVHKIVEARHPGGWEYHIDDRFAFQGSFIDRNDRYPSWAVIGKSGYRIFAYSFGYGIEIGNVFMSADYAMDFHIGLFRDSPRYFNAKPEPKMRGKKIPCPFEFYLYATPQVVGICYNGTLVHGTDPGYDVTMVPLVLRLEAGAQLDITNTFCQNGRWRRIFLRWSPFYFSSPEFAVDNDWSISEGLSFLENCNVVGRWYIGCSWD